MSNATEDLGLARLAGGAKIYLQAFTAWLKCGRNAAGSIVSDSGLTGCGSETDVYLYAWSIIFMETRLLSKTSESNILSLSRKAKCRRER